MPAINKLLRKIVNPEVFGPKILADDQNFHAPVVSVFFPHHSQSQNKFGYVYLLTPEGIAEKMALTGSFLKRKMDEYEALKVEIEALQSEIAAKRSEDKNNE